MTAGVVGSGSSPGGGSSRAPAVRYGAMSAVPQPANAVNRTTRCPKELQTETLLRAETYPCHASQSAGSVHIEGSISQLPRQQAKPPETGTRVRLPASGFECSVCQRHVCERVTNRWSPWMEIHPAARPIHLRNIASRRHETGASTSPLSACLCGARERRELRHQKTETRWSESPEFAPENGIRSKVSVAASASRVGLASPSRKTKRVARQRESSDAVQDETQIIKPRFQPHRLIFFGHERRWRQRSSCFGSRSSCCARRKLDPDREHPRPMDKSGCLAWVCRRQFLNARDALLRRPTGDCDALASCRFDRIGAGSREAVRPTPPCRRDPETDPRDEPRQPVVGSAGSRRAVELGIETARPASPSTWRGGEPLRRRVGRRSFATMLTVSPRWTCSWCRQSRSDCSMGC